MIEEIDKLAKEIGVYIICKKHGKGFVAVTAMDSDDSRVIVGVSGEKDSRELAIQEAWFRGEPFYQKVKERDPATMSSTVEM